LHAIGRALGKDHVVVHLLLKRHGGIVPAPRRRSPRVLTLAEREDISRGIATGCSMRAIAQGLSRACSAVNREPKTHLKKTKPSWLTPAFSWKELAVGQSQVACTVWHRRSESPIA